MVRFLSAILLVAALSPLASLYSQNASFTRLDTVRVRENGTTLRNPAAGGLNLPQFSIIDLDLDGIKDLFVFDRAGNKHLTFINKGSNGQIDYHYAPQYEADFPTDLENFALLADYDCDGLEDIFTSMDNTGIRVYRNTSTPGNLSFSLGIDTVMTDLGGVGLSVLLVSPKDVPAFVDVDGDTDLDVLTFDGGGSFVQWHKNFSIENHGACSFFELEIADACWGKFQESSLNQTCTLNVTCRVAAGYQDPSQFSGRHSGSTVAAFDEDNDGDLELLLGDLIFDGLTYLHNAGDANSALMDSLDANYPAEDVPVRLNIFPAAYVLDINNDDARDILVAPNADNISANYDNVWLYQNFDTADAFVVQHQTTRFLVDEMLDVGSSALPSFFDYNADGLLDLVVGNYNLKISASNNKSGLALYENIGTATAPIYELITRNYVGISGLFNPAIFGVAPSFGDIDADGDQDMIIGDADGKLHLFANAAGAGQTADFSLSQANFMGIDVGGFATPFLVDWNRDSMLDLIVGEWTGKLKYYQNTGTPQAAVFSTTPTNASFGGVDVEAVCCTGNSVPFVFENDNTGKYDLFVGTEKGFIHYYPDAESATGNFVASTTQFGGVYEGGRTAIASADIDGDGKRDWVVGNLRGGLGFYKGDIITAAAPPVEAMAQRISLYPNPSRGQLHVRVDAEPHERVWVRVRDLQGRMLRTSATAHAGETITLECADLPAGMYAVECWVDGKLAATKAWVLAR